jgi:hypothetical protein
MSLIRTIVLSLAVATSAPALSSAGELTVHDLVELHRAGLGEEVLVALIEVDGGPFMLSTADVLDLKALGLPERVIAALVRAGRAVSADAPPDPEPVSTPDDFPSYVETHHTGVVAVPVPIYVPVPRHHRPDPRPGADVWREPQADLRRGRASMPLGTAPGVARSARPTVDDIRHAPPGFHPGASAAAVAPRVSATSGSHSAVRVATSGVVRSTDRPSNGASTPGVARSRRQ